MAAKALTEAERKERSVMQKAVGRKLYKKEFLAYKETLSDRGLSVADACQCAHEVNFMRLWFSLNTEAESKKRGGKRHE